MPRNKILEKAKVSMPTGRNAFDLSQERSFTSLCGEIDVAYCQPFVAGTKGHISRKAFTRTAQVVSPAFHRVTEHFDFFVVPIHSLWRSWENWKVNINDQQDTNLVKWNSVGNVPDLGLPANAPRMDFASINTKLGYLNTLTVSNPQLRAHYANDVIRIMDWLRYGPGLAGLTAGTMNKVMSLLMLGAYQKCYFDHYRNTAYESNNPYAYNFDWLYDGVHDGLLSPASTSTTDSSTQDDYVARELFRIRRVNYRNDAYKNIYPALNYVLSTPSGQSWSLPSGVAGVGNQSGSFSVSSTLGSANFPIGGVQVGLIQNNTVDNVYRMSVQSIRAAFALDKLMRASAYAPKHVRDQYKALYGVDGVEDFDMKSERIGSFQSQVGFVEVTNMAQSATYNLGDLGAKGIGGEDNSKPINFYCKYDSIVIGLHYFLPRTRYDSDGLHPWNTKIAREDFFIRAFENLGLRPFYSDRLNATNTPVIIGWTPPNSEYKILPDLNTGAFRQYFEEYTESGGTVSYTNAQTSELSTYVPHSSNAYVNGGYNIAANAEYFKVSPADLNNLFAVSLPADHRISYFQFYGDMRINVAVVAPMSVHGQPTL